MAEQVWHCVLSAKLPRDFSSRLGVTLPEQCHINQARGYRPLSPRQESQCRTKCDQKPEEKKLLTNNKQTSSVTSSFPQASKSVSSRANKVLPNLLTRRRALSAPITTPCLRLVRTSAEYCLLEIPKSSMSNCRPLLLRLCVGMFEGHQLAMEPISPIGPICPACGFAPGLARLRRSRSCLPLSFGSVSDTSQYALLCLPHLGEHGTWSPNLLAQTQGLAQGTPVGVDQRWTPLALFHLRCVHEDECVLFAHHASK